MWEKLAQNPEVISHLYSTSPSLEEVRVQNVLLEQDGPKLELVVDLNDFPDNPPKKWNLDSVNTVQIVFQLYEIENLGISGWSKNNLLNIKFDHGEVGAIKFSALGVSSKIDCMCNFFRIDRISAYQKIE